MQVGRIAASVVGVIALAGSLTACGNTETAPASAWVVVGDASLSTDATHLIDEAEAHFAKRISNMPAPSSVTFMIFNTDVGSATCPPLTVTLETGKNSTLIDDTRKGYAAQATNKANEYVECALGNQRGTDIFGGIANAADLVKDAPGSKEIDLFTDGCNAATYGTLKIATCGQKVTDPEWRKKTLAELPDEFKPDLSGVTLTMTGIARGSKINSQRVLSLKQFWQEYANLVHATITLNS